MISKAKDVDTYLQDAPPERQAALNQLRDLCLTTLDGFAETMQYGMPFYACTDGAGTGDVAFASQKNYISLYIPGRAMQIYKDQLEGKGISLGKGCVRYSRSERIDFALVEEMLKTARDAAREIH